MSDSLRVFSSTSSCPDIDVLLLGRRSQELVAQLLNQPEFALALEFSVDGESCKSLRPSGEIISFVETQHLGFGALISYGPDVDWEFSVDKPRAEFSVTEIPRKTNDLLLLLSMTLAIAAAEFLSIDSITDYSGMWVRGSDELKIQDIFSMQLKESLSFFDALQIFYMQLPGFSRMSGGSA